jgi:hypothetical protein
MVVFILPTTNATSKQRRIKMTQDTTARILTQNKTQAETHTDLQPGQTETDKKVESYQIRWPAWPTSKPGPRTTPPPAGTKPINAIRREQVTPIAYNQETGESLEAEEPKLTAEQMLGKRKQRL